MFRRSPWTRTPKQDSRATSGVLAPSVVSMLGTLSCSLSHVPSYWPGVQPMNAQLMCSAEQHHLTSAGPRRAASHDPTPATIQAAVRARYPAMRTCYEELMGRIKSGVSGRLEVRFRIGVDGGVDDACFRENELEDQRFAVCILRNSRASSLCQQGIGPSSSIQ